MPYLSNNPVYYKKLTIFDSHLVENSLYLDIVISFGL